MDHELAVKRTKNGKVNWLKTRAVEDLTDNEILKTKNRRDYATKLLKTYDAPWERIRDHVIANYVTTT